ncbi:hypothetical protein N7495_008702 [Penicillium taxi]|uniref:uncharacterized protein n=1 Tax=Penicillium taxi TaxID=168475 RepID=UPI0025451D4E|nr:uncharacterized protein N7495_008702 [Penicillium taxi]KAJ5888661.1 hypothetical protein N7495_008702 [Penicillium taxi]
MASLFPSEHHSGAGPRRQDIVSNRKIFSEQMGSSAGNPPLCDGPPSTQRLSSECAQAENLLSGEKAGYQSGRVSSNTVSCAWAKRNIYCLRFVGARNEIDIRGRVIHFRQFCGFALGLRNAIHLPSGEIV